MIELLMDAGGRKRKGSCSLYYGRDILVPCDSEFYESLRVLARRGVITMNALSHSFALLLIRQREIGKMKWIRDMTNYSQINDCWLIYNHT